MTTVWVDNHFKKFEWEKKQRNGMMIRGGGGGEFNRQLLFIAITMTCLYAEQNHPERVRERKRMQKNGRGLGGYGNYRSKGFWQIREDEIQRQVKGLAFDRRKLLHLLSKRAFSFNRNPVKVLC